MILAAPRILGRQNHKSQWCIHFVLARAHHFHRIGVSNLEAVMWTAFRGLLPPSSHGSHLTHSSATRTLHSLIYSKEPDFHEATKPVLQREATTKWGQGQSLHILWRPFRQQSEFGTLQNPHTAARYWNSRCTTIQCVRYIDGFKKFILTVCSGALEQIMNEVDHSQSYGLEIDMMDFINRSHVLGSPHTSKSLLIHALWPRCPV